MDARPLNATTSTLFAKAHHLVEANEARRISQAEMAERLGISVRAYAQYLQGQETTAMKSLVAVMGMLTEEQLAGLMKNSKVKKANNNNGKK